LKSDAQQLKDKAIILVSKINYLQNPDDLIVTLQELEYALIEAFVGATSNKKEIFKEFNNKKMNRRIIKMSEYSITE